jgi:hypothetical protein
LSSEAEDTKPVDKNVSEALQEFQAIMLVLVERPAPNNLSPEDSVRFDQLVGKYAGLLPVLKLPANAAYGATALLGAQALQAGRIKVAVHIYEEVTFGTSNYTALAYVMQGVGGVALVIVLVLLAFLLLGGAILNETGINLFTTDAFTSELAKALIASFFGCLGGGVSLLLRLHEFESLKGKSRTFLRTYGATQPHIGGIFACVLAALISAKIINISVGGGSSDLSTWLFIVLGFLAGFSERFTRNLLGVAESHFGGAAGPTPQPPQRGP